MNDASAAYASSPRPVGFRLWVVAGAMLALLLLAFVLPSFLSIRQYQRTLTTALARSLGRPVHLSGVDWRLLPTPAFILHDLTVSEDASFGAEPLLTARNVIASVNLLSLLRGRPVFSSIRVDQASLNLVRNDAGRWNLEALLAGPAQQHLAGAVSAAGSRKTPFPYLEASESRINLKSGYEKIPYSLINADLSFWQDQPGQWRIRLRGQPIRTDIAVSGDEGQDSGEIRLEGSLQSAFALRKMPVHLQLAWRNAQLGQLSLLLLGDDAGWRGNLTADLALNGTAESASIQGRLRATNVHRAELGPIAPLDFDSNCGLIFLHSTHAIHQLHCDTSIGDGHLLYAAEIPDPSEHLPRQQTVTLQKIPAQAALDLLRTMRSDFAPGLAASGLFDGQLRFVTPSPSVPSGSVALPRRPGAAKLSDNPLPTVPIWTGSLSLTGAVLRGGVLSQPWTLPRITLQPDPSGTLGARIPLPVCSGKSSASNSSDCLATLALATSGYRLRLTGTASLARLRSWTAAFGTGDDRIGLLDGFTEGAAEMHLQSSGPWIRPWEDAATPSNLSSDALTGSLHLHNARWTHPSLAFPVLIPDATLTLDPASVALHGALTCGPLRAQVAFVQPLSPVSEASVASLSALFDHLDAAALERALTPDQTHAGFFASIASRVHPESATAWPPLRIAVQAEAFTLDRLTLTHCAATLHHAPGDPATTWTLDSFHAALAGGTLQASGTLDRTDVGQRFQLHLDARNLQPAPLTALLHANWSGGQLSANADLTTEGVNEQQWFASATGKMNFDWRHGNLGLAAADSTPENSSLAPPASANLRSASGVFDRWTGSVSLRAGRLMLGPNVRMRHGRSTTFSGGGPLGGPVQLTPAIRPHLTTHP